MSDVDVVNRLYDCLCLGDLEGMHTCFWENAVWVYPGAGPFSGRHERWPSIRDDVLVLLGLFSGGSYRATLVDVAQGESSVVVVLRLTAQYKGRRLDATSYEVIHLDAGRIREIHGHSAEQAVMDAFWRWESDDQGYTAVPAISGSDSTGPTP